MHACCFIHYETFNDWPGVCDLFLVLILLQPLHIQGLDLIIYNTETTYELNLHCANNRLISY